MKTKEEILKLKNNWLSDPCYDIEETEGFEKYKKDLLIFRLRQELKWTKERIDKLQAIQQNLKNFLEVDEIKERISVLEEGLI